MKTIPNSRSCLTLTVSLALTACGREHPGTQVGVEHGSHCILVSTEDLTDLDTVVDSFYGTPREILDELPGSFSGNLQGAEEVPMDGEATLTVDVVDEQFTLQRYESPSTDNTQVGTYCPPQLLLHLNLQLEADGYPSFSDRIEVSILPDDDVRAWSAWSLFDPRDGLDGELPAPVQLDTDTADTVYSALRISGGEPSWGVSMTWITETNDGRGENGGPSIDQELLYMAELARIP